MPEFDKFAAKYDDLLRDPIRDRFAPGSAFFAERKATLIAAWMASRGIPTQDSSWLDVGCGQGELLMGARRSWGRVAGCDLSPEMLSSCDDLNVAVMTDPEKIPFPDESFDFVTAVCVYHHVPPESRINLSRDIRRILKPRGIFCIIEHNPWNPVTRMIVSRTPVDENAILLYPRETREIMKTVQLDVLDSRFFLYLPEAAYRRMGKVEDLLGAVPLGGQYAVFGQRSER